MFGSAGAAADGARRWTAAVVTFIVLATVGRAALATTASPTPAPSATPTEPPVATAIEGYVYEEVLGGALVGARVQYHLAGEGGGEVITDANGKFAFTLDLRRGTWVVIDVDAEGYFHAGMAHTGAELQEQPTLVFRLQPRVYSPIAGLVYDASVGMSAGIGGAQVEYTLVNGLEDTVTDAHGNFDLLLTLPDADYLSVRVSAVGFQPMLAAYPAGEVREARALAIGMQPAALRVDTEIAGLVYDGALGRGASIDGATVDYVYHSGRGAFPDATGSAQTGSDGHYGFVVALGPDDYVELQVSAAGYATARSVVSASQLADGMPVDVALAPLGGVAFIQPFDITLECTQTFDVSVTNVGVSSEILTILSINFSFHYGEGVYGQDFTWDLSQIQFPVLLAAGEAITFPVTFHAGGRFPSLLTIQVVSGSNNIPAAYYYGRNDGCSPSCVGDCDRDGRVTVSELVGGVGLALDGSSSGACVALDSNADLQVSIAELVLAVQHALEGCGPGVTPSVTPALASTPTYTPTATVIATATAAPTAASDALEGALRSVFETACGFTGPITGFSVERLDDGFALFCRPGPGHETHVDLIRHADGTAASTAFISASAPGEPREFHSLPAAYWEVPFYIEDLGGADRFLVWQLRCWVISVHSFDDTTYRIAPQPLELSDAILESASALLMADCEATS